MKQVYEIALLYDFYGELLTESQREILRMYYFEDMSSRGDQRDAGSKPFRGA